MNDHIINSIFSENYNKILLAIDQTVQTNDISLFHSYTVFSEVTGEINDATNGLVQIDSA